MSGQPPEMSPKTRELLARARRMVPPMLEKFHKGKPWNPRPIEATLSLGIIGDCSDGDGQLC